MKNFFDTVQMSSSRLVGILNLKLTLSYENRICTAESRYSTARTPN